MNEALKSKLRRRLQIIAGQVQALERMIEEETYCVDIITQTSAVRHALSSIEDLMLENHLATHVVEQMKSGKHKRATEEILSIYQLSKKK